MEDLDHVVAHKLNDIGVRLARQGKEETALALFEEAIQLEPDYALAYYNLGNSLINLGQPAEAMEAYGSAIQCGETDVTALSLVDKGNIFLGWNRNQEALSSFNEAIRLDPQSALAYNGKGIALQELIQYQEALSAFDEAIRLAPQDSSLHFNKGNLLYDRGQYKEAVQEYDIALRLNPHDPDISRNRELALKKAKRWW
jgi:tetratricopeptide (TPR) repeat protein